MKTKQNIKWWWNIPIILLVGILVSLGFRSILTDDNRYGWGTFSKQVNYQIKYYWIDDKNVEYRYFPQDELKGEAKKKLLSRYNTRYSLGAVKSWSYNYSKYMYENKKPGDNFKAFKAEIYYEINKSRRRIINPDTSEKILIMYPKNIDI